MSPTLQIILAIVSVIASICASVWVAGWRSAMIGSSMSQAVKDIADHELRVRALEKSSEQMASDVHWIRETLQKMHNNGGAGRRPERKAGR